MSQEARHRPSHNHETFRDCLSTVLIERLSQPQPKRRRAKGHGPEEPTTDANDAEELADFIDYIATEVFQSFPSELATLDHYSWADTPGIQQRYPLPLTGDAAAAALPALDPSVAESLTAYGALDPDRQAAHDLLAPVLTEYIATLSAAPPPPRTTRADACELCGRGWVGLTYHHLIPRFVHAKALKRGWHREGELQNVAWLCGACHRFVHRFANHEDLARQYYTVELLMEQPEIQAWAAWVGRLRWKSGKV